MWFKVGHVNPTIQGEPNLLSPLSVVENVGTTKRKDIFQSVLAECVCLWGRYRAKMAHIKGSTQDSGLGFQVKVLIIC